MKGFLILILARNPCGIKNVQTKPEELLRKGDTSLETCVELRNGFPLEVLMNVLSVYLSDFLTLPGFLAFSTVPLRFHFSIIFQIVDLLILRRFCMKKMVLLSR